MRALQQKIQNLEKDNKLLKAQIIQDTKQRDNIQLASELQQENEILKEELTGKRRELDYCRR